MILKRYKDIIAIQTGASDKNLVADLVAFHAGNLEIAEVSTELFDKMTPITVKTATIPVTQSSLALQDQSLALQQLNAWNNEKNPDVSSGKVEFGIKSLTINITQICNLKCTYCAAGGDGTYGDPVNRILIEKTLPQLKFFIDQLKPQNTFKISFVGGEPFLYPEAIKAIYDYVVERSVEKQINCQFMVTTNGTLMTDKAIELLKTMKINITVSLDGEASMNDLVRPSKNGKSSTAQTLEGLQKLSAIKNHLASVGLAAVYSKENMKVKESYLYFRTLNVDWYEFNFSYNEHDQLVQNEFLQQMQEVAELAWQFGQETELRKIKTFNLYFEIFDNQRRIENFCGAGKSYLVIDAKNQLYTCPWEVGNKQEIVGSDQSLDYDQLSNYQKSLVELNNCQTCWARYVCGGGCMFINKTHTGNKHKKDELFCERTRSLILMAILYYKQARAVA